MKTLRNLINQVEDAEIRSKLSAALDTVADEYGKLEGDHKKAQEDLEAIQETLKTKETELAQAQTKAQEAEAVKASLAIREKLASVTLATGGKVSIPVLSKLLSPEDLEKLEVEGSVVKMDGKPLEDYAKANAEWSAFMPSLFPQVSTETQNKPPATEPPLSQGGAPENKGKPDPIKDYLKAVYSVPSFLTPGG